MVLTDTISTSLNLWNASRSCDKFGERKTGSSLEHQSAPYVPSQSDSF